MTIVLAALDADASAQPVLNTAVALATVFEASAVALHVLENGASIPHELASAAGVELREITGSPSEQIVTAAQASDVAALVLGVRGVHGNPQSIGHIALEVITGLRKPVIVVPPDKHPLEQLARILVPLDGTSESARALDDTVKLAGAQGLAVLVLHVHSPATVPAFADHDPHATRAWEREFLARHISTSQGPLRLVRRLGIPADHVVAVAHDAAADLIALAWSQNLSRGHARVVSETLAHSDIPVLLLPMP